MDTFALTPPPTTTRARKSFYSRPTMTGSGNPAWKGGLQDCVCTTCGKKFRRRPDHVDDNVFCSRACFTAFQKGSEWASRVAKEAWTNPDIRERRVTKMRATRLLKSEVQKITVQCPWTDCKNTISVFRSQAIWGGKRGKLSVFCLEHRALVKDLTGRAEATMNGFGRIFADPDRIYTSRAPSFALKLVAFLRYQKSCGICTMPLAFSEQGKIWETDHIVPIFKGGQTTLKNLMPVCLNCHKTKTALEIKEVRKTKPNTSWKFWETHSQKDARIETLTTEVSVLQERLSKLEAKA